MVPGPAGPARGRAAQAKRSYLRKTRSRRLAPGGPFLTNALVFPGDEVAAAEEFQSGPGTYEEGGVVFAARIGVLDLDPKEFIARVRPVTKSIPIKLQVGDVVLGNIRASRASMAIVEVTHHVDFPARDIASDTNGTLHVSKMSESYVDRVEEAVHLGDVVRAHVIQVQPSLQLSTKGEGFGIVRSLCPRCRAVMAAKGGPNGPAGLVCPECDWKEVGKVASDYGRGTLRADEAAARAARPAPDTIPEVSR